MSKNQTIEVSKATPATRTIKVPAKWVKMAHTLLLDPQAQSKLRECAGALFHGWMLADDFILTVALVAGADSETMALIEEAIRGLNFELEGITPATAQVVDHLNQHQTRGPSEGVPVYSHPVPVGVSPSPSGPTVGTVPVAGPPPTEDPYRGAVPGSLLWQMKETSEGRPPPTEPSDK